MNSGYICVRNSIRLDYPVDYAIQSLIPVVDELVLCDRDSDDGTTELLHNWAKLDSRVRVINMPWDAPTARVSWWTDWLQFARSHLRGDMQITLDADECLDPSCYDAIRELAKQKKSVMFKRLNFWRDPWHLAPHNRACGTMVARLGPQHLYMPSDEPHPAFHPNVRTDAVPREDIRILHYGFIRDPKAFLKKSEAVQNAFFGSVDKRLVEHAEKGTDWRDYDYFDGEPLQRYSGTHPEFVKPWLRKNGYDI